MNKDQDKVQKLLKFNIFFNRKKDNILELHLLLLEINT